MSNVRKTSLALRVLSAFSVVLLVAVLAWLTLSEEDPCSNPQTDISGAVLADPDGDQDALVNRAIIMKSKCKQKNH